MLELDFSLVRLIRERVMVSPGKSWPTYDGKTLKRHDFLTASEATKCVRELAFAKAAEKAAVPNPDYWQDMSDEDYAAKIDTFNESNPAGYFVRGDNVELWIVQQIQNSLLPAEHLLCAGDDQVSFYITDDKLSSTPDGVFIDMDLFTMRVLEFKSSQNRVSAPRYAHRTQVLLSVAIIDWLRKRLGDEKFAKIMKWEDYLRDGSLPKLVGATILYVDPSHYLTMQEFHLEPDEAVFLTAQQTAKLLFSAKGGKLREPADLPPEGLRNNGCGFCPFKAACAMVEEGKSETDNASRLRSMLAPSTKNAAPTMPKFTSETKVETIAALTGEYVQYKEEEKRIQAAQDQIKEVLKAVLEDQDWEVMEFEYEGKVYKLSSSTSSRIGGINTAKLNKYLGPYGYTDEDFRKAKTKVTTFLASVKPIEDVA